MTTSHMSLVFPIIPFVLTIQKVVLAIGITMFNSPRPMASSYNYTDPLSNSTAAGAVFGELDPWSSAPSPAGSATPARTTASVSGGRNGTEDGSKEEGLNGLISEYRISANACGPGGEHCCELSTNAGCYGRRSTCAICLFARPARC